MLLACCTAAAYTAHCSIMLDVNGCDCTWTEQWCSSNELGGEQAEKKPVEAPQTAPVKQQRRITVEPITDAGSAPPPNKTLDIEGQSLQMLHFG